MGCVYAMRREAYKPATCRTIWILPLLVLHDRDEPALLSLKHLNSTNSANEDTLAAKWSILSKCSLITPLQQPSSPIPNSLDLSLECTRVDARECIRMING